MNDQQAYEQARAWIARDGATKCSTPNGSCVYLRRDGNRCLIGALLPEELLQVETDQSMIGCGGARVADFHGGINLLMAECGEVVVFFKDCSPMFLRDMQQAHDLAPQGEPFQQHVLSELDRLAKEHGLSVVSS